MQVEVQRSGLLRQVVDGSALGSVQIDHLHLVPRKADSPRQHLPHVGEVEPPLLVVHGEACGGQVQETGNALVQNLLYNNALSFAHRKEKDDESHFFCETSTPREQVSAKLFSSVLVGTNSEADHKEPS